ncbi:peptidoglycan D,D-transpeptidase FtsI family protein [Kineococcus rhizosphaerae]|uniref:Cell elongation-specific peptidoglycan D,D-transpeptidase n=1 Tax=Kineococcus rhizosphaerae TaxID=559628 RepID=A0A2T0QZM8_9ACTN|nr:penicillin-binding protein 2 [Kineococcus rhizosphaerae]PRY12144.1 cell elongation-specific peptidoglycan D,D-transpeptidase [Kineococcus rhizosphaerae]
MNRPLRRLSLVVAFLFFALFASTTWVQFISAGKLNAMPGNSRQLYAEFGRERGAILVQGGAAVATSAKVEDPYQFQRAYPAGQLYAPVTGFYSLRYGTSGVERAENDVLSGSADELFYRNLSTLLTGEKPKGADVTLTIQPKVQQAAWDALAGRKGAVVALDPETGDVLAMVTSPSYDPNGLASHDGKTEQSTWTSLNADDDDPMVNRATGSLYPPGSTFKLITAAAALESGDYTADTLLKGPQELPLPQTSNTLKNDEGTACGPNDQVSLADALKISCNTAFGDLGLTLGADKLAEQAGKFGFGQSLSIPTSVATSSFPTGEKVAGPLLAYSAIGQGNDLATPLQVAMVSAAIANDGVVMEPNLIADVREADQTADVIDQPSPRELGRAVSSGTAKTLQQMMELVVSDGTGTRAQIPGVTVGGKTGTAQHGTGLPPYAWFTSFADDGKKKVAVAVVIEDGGSTESAYGGRLSAPVAKTVMQAALDG